MRSEAKISAARFLVASERPYLAAALWALHWVPLPGRETLSVDGSWRLFYDPAALARWSVRELAGVVYHELCHLLRGHAERRADADPWLWNLAADAEINDDLLQERVALPGQPVTPALLGCADGLLAEEYCGELSADSRGARFRRARLRGQARTVGAGGCGAAVTGEGTEVPALDQVGLSPLEASWTRARVALAIRAAGRSGQVVPGHWSRWAEPRPAPRVDWRRELSARIRRTCADAAGAVDYRYGRPSRRQTCLDQVVLPALRQPRPRLAVVVDTSGSMSEEDLATALGEVVALLRLAGSGDGLAVLAVDHAVQTCQRVVRASQLVLGGGGGTDMAAGLAEVERLRPRPEVAIVITDGYTPWPDRPPRNMSVIVVLVGEGPDAPSWARALRIGRDDLLTSRQPFGRSAMG
jgi:predicted metal-dependent peptidase